MFCITHDCSQSTGCHSKTARMCRRSHRTVSEFTQVKMEDASKQLRLSESECPAIWIRLPRSRCSKSWDGIPDPVVLSEKIVRTSPIRIIVGTKTRRRAGRRRLGTRFLMGMHEFTSRRGPVPRSVRRGYQNDRQEAKYEVTMGKRSNAKWIWTKPFHSGIRCTWDEHSPTSLTTSPLRDY